MMNTLRRLCALEGVSGREKPVADAICEKLATCPAEMEITRDPMGNVIVRIRGEKRAKRTVLFAAHMDEVGLILTSVTEDGFFRIAPVGGVDARILYGRRARVNGRLGVVGGKAVHMCTEEEKKTAPKWDDLLLDVGAGSREEALEIARPGDTAVFDSGFDKLGGGLVKGRAVDDRGGCALLLKLAEQVPAYDIVLAFTVQEEIGLRGAKAVAFAVAPDVAVVVDATTAADTAGVGEAKQVCRVGGGPVISFMDRQTLYDKDLYDHIRALADSRGIRNQTKTLVAGGNDAGAIQRAGAGARVAAVSLPCRYIHSPCCVLAKRDMEDTLALLRALVGDLPGSTP